MSFPFPSVLLSSVYCCFHFSEETESRHNEIKESSSLARVTTIKLCLLQSFRLFSKKAGTVACCVFLSSIGLPLFLSPLLTRRSIWTVLVFCLSQQGIFLFFDGLQREQKVRSHWIMLLLIVELLQILSYTFSYVCLSVSFHSLACCLFLVE